MAIKKVRQQGEPCRFIGYEEISGSSLLYVFNIAFPASLLLQYWDPVGLLSAAPASCALSITGSHLVHNVQGTEFSVQCIVYSVQYLVHTVQVTEFSEQIAVCFLIQLWPFNPTSCGCQLQETYSNSNMSQFGLGMFSISHPLSCPAAGGELFSVRFYLNLSQAISAYLNLHFTT